MKKRYEINMTKGPLLPELLQFILPLMLSSMLQIAFNAADLIVVGRFGRPHSMAAVGANGAMINLIINVLMGLATGGGVLCARYYGANQTDKLHRTVSTTLITGVIVARSDFVEAHPAAVGSFLTAYAASVDWVNANTADAAALIGEYGIVDAAVAEKALPYCNIVCITGAELLEKLPGYLSVLYTADPAAVGGALPDNSFYFA